MRTMPTMRNAVAVVAILSMAGILSILNMGVYNSATKESKKGLGLRVSTSSSIDTPPCIVTAPAPIDTAPAASGSTGIRFSGDKVRVFNVNNSDNGGTGTTTGTTTGLLAIDSSSSHLGNKKKIIFPSPSSAPEDDSDGGFGSGTACEQWAVVTTIHVPNPSINGVADLRNWCLVIVGDTITPDDAYSDLAKKDDVFYLSASYQKTLWTESETETEGESTSRTSSSFSSFIEMMPFKSFARKNIGYLFAISNGAQVIFDFDDDNVLMPLEDGKTIPPPIFHFGDDGLGLDRTVLLKFININSEEKGGATSTTKRQSQTDVPPPLAAPLVFNPYIFMGASHQHSWPRGFPIDQLQNNFVNVNGLLADIDTTEVGDLPYSSIGVIQSLCNGDPDNDAVFRMTRPDSTNFSFERSAKSLPLLIPSNAYSPYNAQATTHLYNAFWGLYLPITVAGRVTDIWRSYITQRIMKDLGLHVIYTPPIVQHERSAHDYLSDFVAESDLYDKTTKLLEFLDGWSSDARKLPERIFELWVGLYEHDYIGLHDVEAAREWLNTLITIGYKFPSIIDINSRASMALPRTQPSLDGQPYRSLPHFNNAAVAQSRPDSAVVKLIMMTMDEWPLLKSWVMYHGRLLGFENLYIVDSSTDARCASFLRYARDSLGANVLFSDANLNQLESIMTKIGKDIGGSSDFIMKVDTDEFLVVHDESTNTLTTSISDYLSGFANNQTHPLHLVHNYQVGYIQGSMPLEEVCKKNIYSTPEKFPLDQVSSAPGFKMVYNSKLMATGATTINLGGHAIGKLDRDVTRFSFLHYHKRCVEIEIENCKRVLERHDFISSSDTDQEAKVKLANMFDCSTSDMCNTCVFNKRFNSFHKAVFYLRWLDCPEKTKEEYYGDVSKGQYNSDVINAMQLSHERFDL